MMALNYQLICPYYDVRKLVLEGQHFHCVISNDNCNINLSKIEQQLVRNFVVTSRCFSRTNSCELVQWLLTESSFACLCLILTICNTNSIHFQEIFQVFLESREGVETA